MSEFRKGCDSGGAARTGASARIIEWQVIQVKYLRGLLPLLAAAPQPVPAPWSRRRHHEAVERETLIALPILSNQLDGPERERSPAEFRVNGILDVAPEVPVDVNPARISAGEEPNVSADSATISDIWPALTPQSWNMPGLWVSTYELAGSSVASCRANRTSARAAHASSVVARTSGAYQRN